MIDNNVRKKPFILFKNNVLTDVNLKFMRLTGFAKKEIMGKSVFEIKNLLKISAAVNLKDLENDINCFIFTKNLEPLEVKITPCIISKIEMGFLIQEKRHSRIDVVMPCVESIFSDNKIGVAIYSTRHKTILKFNHKFMEFSNIGQDKICDLIGKSWTTVFPNEAKNYKDFYRKFLITGKPYHLVEVKSRNNNKDTYWNLDFIPIIINNRVKYLVQVVREVTEFVENRKLIYKQAQYSSMKQMIDNLEFGIVRFTYPDFKIIDINNKGYQQLKEVFPEICPQDLLINKSICDLFIVSNNYEDIEIIKESIYNKRIYSKTIKYNVMGIDVFHKYIFQPIFDINNEIIEIVVIGIDITEEESTKILLENTLKIQDEIYSNVAHELKTPLNVIFSANQVMDMFLKNDLLEKDRFISYNNSIKQNCYRLIKLINNIVDISKSNAGFFKVNLTNENIVDIIKSVVNSVSEYVNQKNMKIEFETNSVEKIIACDPIMIERVILNLISNAIKFSKPNSVIIISFEDKGNVVEISVKDEGIGIREEDITYLFDRFYRVDRTLSRNTEGSGIGLHLIKCIVVKHGGNVTVKSKLGEGSTFKVQLPARITDNTLDMNYNRFDDNKIERINIEFSDIYS